MKTFLLFLITSCCFAQNTNLVVTYGLVFYEDESMSKKTSMFKEHLDYAIANPNRFKFELKIDSIGASFELKNKLSMTDSNLSDNLGFLFAKYPGLIFSFPDSILKRSVLLGNKVFVKSNLIVGWQMTNESKNIDGYICYKATNDDRVKDDTRAFFNPIIAWYCPEIPYSYGPIGYGNLPGLILELQVRNVVYAVTKIDFQSKEFPDYQIIKKSEVISVIEQDQRRKKIFDE